MDKRNEDPVKRDPQYWLLKAEKILKIVTKNTNPFYLKQLIDKYFEEKNG